MGGLHDNGPEYISHALREWAQATGIELMYIQPGKPTQNAYIERFNRTARNEWLNMHIFDSIDHAQNTATQWMWVYNNVRPHSCPERSEEILLGCDWWNSTKKAT